MDKFEAYVLPYLVNSYFRYLADGEAKSMSVEYFQKSFTSIAATELINSGQRYFYYQNKETLELVMRFRISQAGGLSATMMRFSDFEKQFCHKTDKK
ncbi:hypothetical protein [Adhaeribacter rhizoryzae]|uniref:Uncharacterized protein n=1 Tax=Adhaeribacter rhizoryzae TaxID=2607907 RepID=A0A5M6CV41_9BACT|nr:hypothetical protein [Adhaeribacter rhizoryzae]KAA5539118.1 hypothetical protein F0145_24940 [Adhaeribacter rhizoryzae]